MSYDGNNGTPAVGNDSVPNLQQLQFKNSKIHLDALKLRLAAKREEIQNRITQYFKKSAADSVINKMDNTTLQAYANHLEEMQKQYLQAIDDYRKYEDEALANAEIELGKEAKELGIDYDPYANMSLGSLLYVYDKASKQKDLSTMEAISSEMAKRANAE